MLELALYVLIFELIDRYLSKDLKRKLMTEESSYKRILLRRRVRRNRTILLWIFGLFLIFTEVMCIISFVKDPTDEYAMRSMIWTPALCLLYFVFFKKWKRIKGNISTYDLESFNYRDGRYSLFLRGFDNDNYEKIDKLEEGKTESYDHLSEYWFFKLLGKKYKQPVVSVGMTKEMDSPLGTKRIYLDDEEWKAGVRTLMENAERIFILVNDRESCIWEIIQSKDLLDRTEFIVDDMTKYNAVKEKTTDYISLPSIQLEGKMCALISHVGTQCDVQYFENSRMGYAKLLGTRYTSLKKKRKRALWGVFVPLGVLALLIISLVLVDVFKSRDRVPVEVETVAHAEIEEVISPYTQMQAELSEMELPIDLGGGIFLVAIDIMEDKESVKFSYIIEEEEIDMISLKENAKSNILTAIMTNDKDTEEMPFWRFCKDNGINLIYFYQSNCNESHDFSVILSVEEITRAFDSQEK